jgi:hypothetical protein
VYREPPLPFAQKTGLVAFIATNCHAGAATAIAALSHPTAGGALARTRYVLELMKRMPAAVPAAAAVVSDRVADVHVDSYGDCLRNAAVPPDVAAAVGFNLSAHYWADPGAGASGCSRAKLTRAGWRLKRALLRSYKFVLAFENSATFDGVARSSSLIALSQTT